VFIMLMEEETFDPVEYILTANIEVQLPIVRYRGDQDLYGSRVGMLLYWRVVNGELQTWFVNPVIGHLDMDGYTEILDDGDEIAWLLIETDGMYAS